jgi:GAF domain-containing protein
VLRASIGIPLTSADQVVGVITLESLDEARPFGEREIAILQRFAQLAAVALDNARLFERERTQAQRQAALVRLSADLAGTLEADDVCLSVAHV